MAGLATSQTFHGVALRGVCATLWVGLSVAKPEPLPEPLPLPFDVAKPVRWRPLAPFAVVRCPELLAA